MLGYDALAFSDVASTELVMYCGEWMGYVRSRLAQTDNAGHTCWQFLVQFPAQHCTRR